MKMRSTAASSSVRDVAKNSCSFAASQIVLNSSEFSPKPSATSLNASHSFRTLSDGRFRNGRASSMNSAFPSFCPIGRTIAAREE